MRESKLAILVFFLLVLSSGIVFSACIMDGNPCPPCLAGPFPGPPCCGDGECSDGTGGHANIGETCRNCPTDCPTCPSLCGDGKCELSMGEDAASCPADCGTCGNGVKDELAGENCQTCQGRDGWGTCPSCTPENADSVCPAALPDIQRNCTLYYCDPKDNKCVYDMASYEGKPCGNVKAPYSDECHVDVCIKGVCNLNASIDSTNPFSAGGMPPLTNPSQPWMKGECFFDGSDFKYKETEIHPFCGHWGCETGLEDSSTCCEDCPCGPNEVCMNGVCQNTLGPVALTCGNNKCEKGEDSFNCPLDCRGWFNWIPVAVIALLFGYILAALVFMAAHIISSPELLAWSKNELYEVSVSAMLVGSAIFFAGLLSTLSVTLIGVDYQIAAENYVRLLSGELLSIYGALVKGIFAMGLLGYIGADLALPIIVTGIVNIGTAGSIYPFGGLNLLSNTLVMFSNVLSFAIIATIGQKVILDFILQTAFRVLLPVAVVLRCFTFTRKLGATLMAIAIGAYIVYPMTLVMNAQLYDSVPRLPRAEYHSSAFPLDNFNMGVWMDVFLGPNFGKWCKHWYDWLWYCWIFAIVEWVINLVKAIFGAFAFILQVVAALMRLGVAEVTAQGFDYYTTMIPWAIQPVTAAFLFPVLDLLIVITSIRSLSEAIGGETRITGLAEFI